MKKGLISLMLAGAMVGAVGTMAACDKTEKISNSENSAYATLYEKNMIVALYEKKITLHRVDIYSQYVDPGPYSTYALSDKLVFKCGRDPVETKMYQNYGTFMPPKEAYDEVCATCFPTSVEG